MSRLEVINWVDLEIITSFSSTNSKLQNNRSLILVLNSNELWLAGFAKAYSARFIPPTASTDRSDRITAVLGSETDRLVHQIGEYLDAGLLAALSGTLKSGGLLILGIPGQFVTPSPTEPPVLTNQTSRRFNERFLRLLKTATQQFPNNVIWTELAPSDLAQVNRQDTEETIRQMPTMSGTANSSRPSPLAEQEQDSLLQEVRRYLSTYTDGCITLTGRRGRGKSTLLARIANELQAQNIPYEICAPHVGALGSFFRHIDHKAPPSRMPAHTFSRKSGTALLVDEAGNMPLGTITSLLDKASFFVFSTTVEGYEGSGRAFSVRFMSLLNQHFEKPLHLTPQHPWRWGVNDPIEFLMDALIVNDADTCKGDLVIDSTQRPGTDKELTQIRELTQEQLASDEALLCAVFKLLRQTHYQTSIADLQHLLDGDALKLWVLESHQPPSAPVIIGVALLSVEGAIPSPLHDAVQSGQRRLKHHLLPQLLAQTANNPTALGDVYWRVVRIAIRAPWRQRGLGSYLLQAIEQSALSNSSNHPISAIGASFAADSINRAFWQKNGYAEFHHGFRRNPRTGKQAVAIIKSFGNGNGNRMTAVIDQAHAIHHDNQYWLQILSSDSHDLYTADIPSFSYDERSLLTSFAKGHRSPNDTIAALARLARQKQIPDNFFTHLSQRSHTRALRQQVADILLNSHHS